MADTDLYKSLLRYTEVKNQKYYECYSTMNGKRWKISSGKSGGNTTTKDKQVQSAAGKSNSKSEKKKMYTSSTGHHDTMKQAIGVIRKFAELRDNSVNDDERLKALKKLELDSMMQGALQVKFDCT